LTTDQLIAWGTVLGSLFTAASVLFAIIAYQRQQDRLLFSSLRTSLVDIEASVNELDLLLNESRLVEVGDRIAGEIRDMVGHNADKSVVINFLEDEKNHNYIATAIHMGINRSKTVDAIDGIAGRLKRLPYLNLGQIPILREIVSGCVFYVTMTAEGAVSPRVFDQILGKAELRKKHVIPAIEAISSPALIFQEISVLVSAASGSALKSQGQAVLDDIRQMMAILTRRITELRDSDLRALRNRLSGAVIRDPKDTTAIEDVFTPVDRIRHLFEDTEWDSLVESKARIQATAHPKNTDGGA